MRRSALLLVLAAAIVPAGTAHAGGWATVELDGMPAGVGAGEPWRMQMLVKQHGRTPLDGLTPSVRIDNGEGVVRTFRARPAGRPGWYEATVIYPSPGTWKTRLFDGFSDATSHRLAPLEVTAAGSAFVATGGRSDAPASNGAGTAGDQAGSAAASGAVTAGDRTGSPGVSDDGFPWPQVVAIAFVVALWTAGWIAVSGPRRRRAPVAGRYLPAE